MRFADFGSQDAIIEEVNISPNDDPYLFRDIQ